MKTTWQEIKERVQFKTGEDIDPTSFKILANETTSELNEIAYIETAPLIYETADILHEDPVSAPEKADKIVSALEKEGVHNLPFEYVYGHNQLTMITEYDGTLTPIENPFYFKEIDTYNGISEQVTIIADNSITAEELSHYSISFECKVLRSIKRQNNFYNNLESVITLPEELSSITKIEVIDNLGNNDVAIESSINSMDMNNMDENIKSFRNTFYIMNERVHMFSQVKAQKIILYYIKRMSRVTDRDLSLQDVELEQNYENLLVLGITTKWWENFVGLKDTETKALYQRYQILKAEYEAKNMPRKIKKRQRYIRVL